MLTLDGSQGEGGGQILRTALSLSMITGTPFTLDHVRAKRSRPGLQRQHLTCVTSAAAICGAQIGGAAVGSKTVTFTPGPIVGGDYTFAIGTAGSTPLVFQTLLPALLHAATPSRVAISGGTHNPFSPTFDYLDRVVCPLLARMGADVPITLHQAGFYPAGGGRIEAVITPAKLVPLVLMEAGARLSHRVRADVAHIPYDVAQREIAAATELLAWPVTCGEARTVRADGPGNVVMIEIVSEHVTDMFTSFGERQRSVEDVVGAVVADARAYMASGAPVGPNLADQLLLLAALAGGGEYVTMTPTAHTRTNADVICRFLDVTITLAERADGRWRVKVG